MLGRAARARRMPTGLTLVFLTSLAGAILTWVVVGTMQFYNDGHNSSFLDRKAREYSPPPGFTLLARFKYLNKAECDTCFDTTVRLFLRTDEPIDDARIIFLLRPSVVEQYARREDLKCPSCIATFKWRRAFWIGARGKDGYIAIGVGGASCTADVSDIVAGDGGTYAGHVGWVDFSTPAAGIPRPLSLEDATACL
jgi:hypothetical protein